MKCSLASAHWALCWVGALLEAAWVQAFAICFSGWVLIDLSILLFHCKV